MSEGDITTLIDALREPPAEFTPMPFWFLNDSLDKNELKRQLVDFQAKGVNGVVLHPRIGIPETLPYLSETYLDIIKYIVQTASELNMRIVLYDEAMYPSGSAHGEVVQFNPAYASMGITLTRNRCEGKVIAEFDDGYFILQKPSGGTIRGIHFGEDDGEAHAPKSADILNPAAVDKFIELTHDRYFAALGAYFGNTIIGFFTDEPSILGRNAGNCFEWTDGLERELVAAGGQLNELRALFEHEENLTTKLYRHILVNRLNDVYYKKLSAWCSAHQVALMGHPKESDDIDEQVYFHIPGQDLVYRRFSPETGGLDARESVQAKCSADAARHTGKRRNSNECFGVCVRDGIPWYMTGSDMKWFIDYLGVRGVNLFIPHAFYYSLDGARKDERPPDVGPNNIWWPYYKKYSDYMKRLSYIMTDSVNCARIAVLCESGHMPVAELIPFYENQVEFNYLPISLLAHAELRDGRLCINGYAYDYLLSAENLDIPVKKIRTVFDIEYRDFVSDTPCAPLRAAHLIKDGADMYFLTNEGTAPISCTVSVPIEGIPLFFDLWEGTHYRPEYTKAGNRMQLRIELGVFESLLILFDKDSNTAASPHQKLSLRNDILAPLRLVSHDISRHRKIYQAEFTAETITGSEAICLDAEEMVECYCNGCLVGVSFWNPHTFSIGSLLKEGANQLELIVTGNIANRYSGHVIPYGLKLIE